MLASIIPTTDSEDPSETISCLTTNCDQQTLGNGSSGHPQIKVSMSSQYLLVEQDYFSKWPFAITDQEATTFVTVSSLWDYTQTRGETLRVTSCLSCARHLG